VKPSGGCVTELAVPFLELFFVPDKKKTHIDI